MKKLLLSLSLYGAAAGAAPLTPYFGPGSYVEIHVIGTEVNSYVGDCFVFGSPCGANDGSGAGDFGSLPWDMIGVISAFANAVIDTGSFAFEFRLEGFSIVECLNISCPTPPTESIYLEGHAHGMANLLFDVPRDGILSVDLKRNGIHVGRTHFAVSPGVWALPSIQDGVSAQESRIDPGETLIDEQLNLEYSFQLTPEPGSAVLIGPLLAALVLVRRRRRS